MAGAESVISFAVEKLGQLIINETNFLCAVRGDVEWMQSELRWMKGFLKDADAKARKGDQNMKNWIREVTDVAYQAEDAVDTFMFQIETKRGSTKEFFRRYACIPSEPVHLHYIGNEIKQIKSKIHNIRESKDRYDIRECGEPSGSTDETLQTRRARLSDDTIVVGFDNHKELILERVFDTSVQRRSVISVVGMGGLGKTTLAAKVYNTDEVKSGFKDCRIWITVSQEFNACEFLKKIIKKITKEDLEKLENNLEVNQLKAHLENLEKIEVDELKEWLCDYLKEKKYLIVLDDIWEQAVWEQLKDAFPDVNNGSRLLITTRVMEVGKSADPWGYKPYELPLLSDEESWELFLKVVFPSEHGETPECPKDLQNLGQELVKRCGGLPLGVVVLGGLLRVTYPTISAWRQVAEDKEWEFKRPGIECLEILALSYNHLPHDLKSCFLYIGCFPEDHEIITSELTKFWIGEGFIPKRENRTFEETTKGYLDEMVQRCMIQVVSRTRTSRSVKCFRIHDLFRDWCITEAKEEGFFRICTSNSDNLELIASRRLAVHNVILPDGVSNVSCKARAFLSFNNLSSEKFLWHRFKLLRVIYLQIDINDGSNLYTPHVYKLPKEISSLIHLRNITLRGSCSFSLPSSIGKLHNLQTCDVNGIGSLKLPKTFYKIQNLRHIQVLNYFPTRLSAIGNLTNLQTLKVIDGGSSMLLKDLAKLSNLRRLSIANISQAELLFASLHNLNLLVSLKLSCNHQPAASLFTSSQAHPRLSKLYLDGWTNVGPVFPQNLINITLNDCTFGRDVIAALENLASLVILNLNGCRLNPGEEFIFSSNGFPRLESLQIYGMDWRTENGALPNLKYLRTETHKSLPSVNMNRWINNLLDGSEELEQVPSFSDSPACEDDYCSYPDTPTCEEDYCST